MQNEPNIFVERLAQVMRERSISQSELARRVGITPGAVQQIVRGTTRKSKYIHEIARSLDVSVDWLSGEDIAPGQIIGRDESAVAYLAEIDVGYGMGGGTFIEESDEGDTMAVFDPRWLEAITKSPPQMLFVAKGVGDSMMPTLLDNDTLLVDRGQRKITQQDRIWAITYGELGMVKRVRRTPQGKFLLMSDNAAITTIEAVEDEIHVVGRIVWIGRKA